MSMDELDQRLRDLGNQGISDDGFTSRVMAQISSSTFASSTLPSPSRTPLLLSRIFMGLSLLFLFLQTFLLIKREIPAGMIDPDMIQNGIDLLRYLPQLQVPPLSLALALGLAMIILFDCLDPQLEQGTLS